MKPSIQAWALADELNALGFWTVVVTREHLGRRYPCLRVTSGRTRHVRFPELVYAAPVGDDEWWFWFGDMEPIAPIGLVGVAAEVIDATISVHSHR
jgi:hypothetical protein